MASRRERHTALGITAPFPGFIEPVEAEQVDRVPRGERWVHGVKFDGYRGQLHIANNDVRILTRRGLDWTNRFRKVAIDAHLISAKSAIIDGEIVVPLEGGKTDFAILQKSLTGKADNISMIAFDLLYLNGRDLRKAPLVERKAALKSLLAGTPIEYSEHFDMDGAELFRRVNRRRKYAFVYQLANATLAQRAARHPDQYGALLAAGRRSWALSAPESADTAWFLPRKTRTIA